MGKICAAHGFNSSNSVGICRNYFFESNRDAIGCFAHNMGIIQVKEVVLNKWIQRKVIVRIVHYFKTCKFSFFK